MSAGKIEIAFEGLCPFFTKHLPENRLIVGVLGIFGADSVTHTPKMTITEEDVCEPVIYTTRFGRKALSGEAFFHLFSEAGAVAAKISQAEDLALLDVETVLYHEDETENDELEIDPAKCQVRFHFNNGVLSPMRSTTVGFFDLEVDEDEPIPTLPPKSYTYNAKLQIEIPEGGYAVLHFSEQADDVVFKSGRNYVIKVESLPASEHGHHENTEDDHDHEEEDTEINHFQYFYLLAKNDPERKIVPRSAVSGPVGGDPFCMLAAFGNTEYE